MAADDDVLPVDDRGCGWSEAGGLVLCPGKHSWQRVNLWEGTAVVERRARACVARAYAMLGTSRLGGCVCGPPTASSLELAETALECGGRAEAEEEVRGLGEPGVGPVWLTESSASLAHRGEHTFGLSGGRHAMWREMCTLLGMH